MVLKNFGHGQTLEWFEHNSKAYFWVTCKANEAYDFKWGTQIGRIQYKPTDKKGIDYTEIPRFSHMRQYVMTPKFVGSWIYLYTMNWKLTMVTGITAYKLEVII